jgi:hypothetical protein
MGPGGNRSNRRGLDVALAFSVRSLGCRPFLPLVPAGWNFGFVLPRCVLVSFLPCINFAAAHTPARWYMMHVSRCRPCSAAGALPRHASARSTRPRSSPCISPPFQCKRILKNDKTPLMGYQGGVADFAVFGCGIFASSRLASRPRIPAPARIVLTVNNVVIIMHSDCVNN